MVKKAMPMKKADMPMKGGMPKGHEHMKPGQHAEEMAKMMGGKKAPAKKR